MEKLASLTNDYFLMTKIYALLIVYFAAAALALVKDQFLVSRNSQDLAFGSGDYLLIPDNRNNDHVALIMVPGALVSPHSYAALAKKIQEESMFMGKRSVFFGGASFLGNLALGSENIAKGIDRVYEKLREAGLSADAEVFLVGHSLGGAMIQDYVMQVMPKLFSPSQVKGTIFYGAPLQRKYNGTLYQKPWISVSGELDGIVRSIRVAEMHYHYNQVEDDSALSAVIVKGMNHMQFTDKPYSVATRFFDLKPSVSTEDAISQVAKYTSAFIIANSKSNEGLAKVKKIFKEGKSFMNNFMKPYLEALFMEANGFLKKPCNSDNPSPHCPFYPIWPPQEKDRPMSDDTDCFCETPWASVAVKAMAGLDESKFDIVSADSIHDVRDTKPFHHAYIWNNCSDAYRQEHGMPLDKVCTLNVTTVSEGVYETLDSGFLAHSTASELRVKMKSRQLYRRASVDPLATFDVDDINICAMLNEKAFLYAYNLLPQEVQERFDTYGTKMVFEKDYHFIIPVGPLFIETPLQMRKGKSSSGDTVLYVRAIR